MADLLLFSPFFTLPSEGSVRFAKHLVPSSLGGASVTILLQLFQDFFKKKGSS